MSLGATNHAMVALATGSGEGRARRALLAAASPTCMVIAVVALGRAVQARYGTGTPLAVFLLAVALLCATASVGVSRADARDAAGERIVRLLIAGGIAYQLEQLFTVYPGLYGAVPGPQSYALFHAGLAVSGVLAGVCLSAGRRAATIAFVALLLVHFTLSCWMIRTSPTPGIDVWVWHREAFARLASGANPYVPPMPNIYGNGLSYAPGATEGDKVLVGFPYPPASLLVADVGHMIAGDYRYAAAVALVGAAGLSAFSLRSPLAFGATALSLLTPRVFMVVELGFTEPFALCALAGVAFAANRRPQLLPYAFGIALAMKQYLVLAIPLTPLLFAERPSLRQWLVWTAKAVATAAATCLPFLLRSPVDFIQSVVVFQARQPFRIDSLSFLAWWAKQGGAASARLWLTFAVAVPLTALSLRRLPRHSSGFFAGVGLVILGFFAFSKQAFCNYYFLALYLLSAGLAGFRSPRAAPGSADAPRASASGGRP